VVIPSAGRRPAPPEFDPRSRRAYRYSVTGLCPGIPRAGDPKLSKRFYDVLGEDVANELVDWFNAVDLTYRTDLRELNELNFARFDAKLEQRLAEFDAKLRTELAALRAEFRTELAGLRTSCTRRSPASAPSWSAGCSPSGSPTSSASPAC
jgi:hypothetical protein